MQRYGWCNTGLWLILAGVFLGWLGGAQRSWAEVESETVDEPNAVAVQTARIAELAETDHIALLRWAMEHYDENVKDYTLTFYRQERIRGRLRAREVVAVQFRNEPFSLYMQWRENPGRADKLLYVDGQNDGNMLVHPTGLFAWLRSVQRHPHHRDVVQNSLRTPDQFGFRNTIESMLEVYEQAQEKDELIMHSLGPLRIGDRPCIAMERVLPAGRGYPYARLVVAFDLAYLLPVSVTCYDWDGRLVSQYIYEDIVLNPGLTAEDFTPAAHGL